MKRIFTPNAIIDKSTMRILIAAQIALIVFVWIFSPSALLPKPGEVFGALTDLWEQGLGAELITSFYLNVQSIILATIISLALSYATVLPFFRPIVGFIGKVRFLSPAGITLIFTMIATGSHELKVSLLVFFITVFFITSMVDVMGTIPKEQFDLARTLHMSEWRVVWEVIILGQFDKVFDVIRQNAAMAFMMLTMVEGIARGGGGIGEVLLDQNKHFRIEAVFAIQLVILCVGIGQDFAIGVMKKFFCPYAFLTVEAR